jgi:serine protease AprX
MAKKHATRSTTRGKKKSRASAARGAVPAPIKAARKAAAPETVSIEVLLQPSEAAVAPADSAETISFSNVAKFQPTFSTRDQAVKRLSSLGFKVLQIGDYSISLEGTPRLFEDTFGTALEVRSVERLQTATSTATTSFFAPAPSASWTPPDILADIVHRAYIQPPAIYFESALAPRVKYHHLAVPGDVAMLLGAAEVHRKGITGKGVKVVMVDTGFYNHRFYQEQGYNAHVTLGPGASNVNEDENGHGTAEAANIFAVAPDVTFTMVKAGLNSTAAFKAAVQLGPDIISCSWGFDLVVQGDPQRTHVTAIPNFLKALELEVANAVAQGIIVVFSAGNGHVGFPGMHPDVISAGGVFVDADESLRASDYASAFDSKPYPGRHVPDFCGLVGMKPRAAYIMLPVQPNCEIDQDVSSGTFPNGDETQPNDGWSVISGTSAAAPQLAGVCALLKQKKPSLTPLEAKQVLAGSARDCTQGVANDASNEFVPVQASAGSDGATGDGLVDAEAAIELV